MKRFLPDVRWSDAPILAYCAWTVAWVFVFYQGLSASNGSDDLVMLSVCEGCKGLDTSTWAGWLAWMAAGCGLCPDGR